MIDDTNEIKYNLNPCVKCKNLHLIFGVDILHDSKHFIICLNCNNKSQSYYSLNDAVDNWNKENSI